MLSFDVSNPNTQAASPLFSRIPGEIRDRIFELAITPYTSRQKPYAKDAKYYRPGFRYGDQRLDCALLRTCRRIYQETYYLPARNYVRVDWNSNGPPDWDQKDTYHPELRTLHLFTQQIWLESWRWAAQQISQQAQDLRHLRITLRHSDWWAWEASAPLTLDAKQAGTASKTVHSTASDGFDLESWGYQFHFLKGLEVFELELETVESKRKELDDIVARAADWQFPLGDDNVLAFNAAKTKRTAWNGLRLWAFNHVPNDPIKAKERLEADGVDFKSLDGEPEICDEDCLTYYVVTLTYEAKRKPRSSDAPTNTYKDANI